VKAATRGKRVGFVALFSSLGATMGPKTAGKPRQPSQICPESLNQVVVTTVEPRILSVIQGRSYIERSPISGLHAICRGRLPRGRRQWDDPREFHVGFGFYVSSRYLALTGRVCPESGPIQDLTPDFVCLHRGLFPIKNRTMTRASLEPPPVSLRDAELLDKARRAANGYAFIRLFDHGDWQGIYPSQSEADLALCHYLAFWTGCNPSQIDRLFRESALFDEKWEKRADYRQRTIGLAISSLSSTYNPGYYRTRGNNL
jgi:putative DNA primase/helicase